MNPLPLLWSARNSSIPRQQAVYVRAVIEDVRVHAEEIAEVVRVHAMRSQVGLQFARFVDFGGNYASAPGGITRRTDGYPSLLQPPNAVLCQIEHVGLHGCHAGFQKDFDPR